MSLKNVDYKQQATNNKLLNENERNNTTLSNIANYSTFDKSFQLASSFDSGKCVPILIQEVYPGDIYKIDTNALVRLSAPSSTPMMNLNYDLNFFFVPYDEIDPQFKELMGENPSYGYSDTLLNFPKLVGSQGQNINEVNWQSSPNLVDYELRITTNNNWNWKYDENDLANYLGVPINSSLVSMVDSSQGGIPNTNLGDKFYQSLNIYPFLAYGKIWNDWYRDQNLQDSIDISSCFNSTRTLTYFETQDSKPTFIKQKQYKQSIIYGVGLAPSSKLPDLFTTCLPYQQKGEPLQLVAGGNVSARLRLNNLVLDPMNIVNGTTTLTSQNENSFQGFNPMWWFKSGSSSNTIYKGIRGVNNPSNEQIRDGNYAIQMSNISVNANDIGGSSKKGNSRFFTSSDSNVNNERVSYLWLQTPRVELQPSGSVDIINTNPNGNVFNIHDLRNSLVYQHLLENWALCGSRYVEQLKSIWGIEIDPKNINRSELIGGTNETLKWNMVQQTSSSTTNSPLGNLASNLYNSVDCNGIEYASSQHGIIMGILTIRSKINYGGQGLPKIFDYNNMYDLWNPMFNGISEQPVRIKELTLQVKPNDANKTFGFQEPFIHTKMNVDNSNGFMSLFSSRSLFSLFLFGSRYDDVMLPNNTYVKTKSINEQFIIYDPNLIGNSLFNVSNQTKQFYHQFIALFTHNIQYTTKQPLYNSPRVYGI